MLSNEPDDHRFFATAALAISVFAIWALTHEYRGPVLDGQIYAVQALAKLRPSLNSDLFLQNTTQDQFTVFPRIYAWFIALIGLNQAALLLTALFSIWFLYATWKLTAHLSNRDYAWPTLFLLIITGGHYGAFGVFRFLEPFLTARLAAEALIITALAFYMRGFEWAGLLIAIGALFVHPLMALPGLLLLICMRVPLRVSLAAAAIGTLICLTAAIAASTVPAVEALLPIMDTPWLDVVRERSQFLFLQLWTVRDWELNARPFVCLTLTWMTLRDDRVRKLAGCAMLVGATGLLVAGIASLVGPAILMQGQAWRWMWVTTFVSVVLLLPTALRLWREDKWGPACAVSLVVGWSFSADIGFVYASLALLLWTFRGHRRLQSDRVNRYTIAVICISVIAWAVVDTGEGIASLASASEHTHSVASSIRAVFELKIWCVLLASALWYWTRKSKSPTRQIFVVCALATGSAFLIYEPFIYSRSYGSVSDMNEFSDWRQVIPPTSTVFVTNGYDSGSFVWFTLERNNYLSPGQSAGVVFSRATALEVRRRSEVLLPLVDPNWKMLTSLRRTASGAAGAPLNHHALTPRSLLDVCADSALGFVISPDSVGFDPIRHAHEGTYKNWNLYDCNRVRGLRSAT
jgi:hypothetical protein